MKISEAFLVNTKNFNAIIEALASYDDDNPVIDSSLLEMLGYTDPNDLLVVRLLKDLNIINQDGEAGKYFEEFQDQETTKKALAKGTLDAYAPLFEKDDQIYKADIDELKKTFNDIFDGEKTTLIIKYISGTFHKITSYCGAETIEAVMANREVEVEEEQLAAEMAMADHSSNGVYNNNVDISSPTTSMEQETDRESTENLKDIPMKDNDQQQSDFEQETLEQGDAETTHPENIEGEDIPGETMEDSQSASEAVEPETSQETPVPSVDKDPGDLSVSMSDVTQPKLSTEQQSTDDSTANSQSFVEKALIRKSELLHQLQRWEELIPALDEVIEQFDNAEHSYLNDVVSRSIVRRAFVLVKLHRTDDALPALDKVINRFKDADNEDLHKHASVAMLHKAELLEENTDADLLPLYNDIINRLDGHHNDHLSDKVDLIFNKRFDLILKEGSNDDILDASRIVIDRFKNQSKYQGQLQKAMIKRAEVLDETDRSEEALEAYDEFLAKFG